MSASEQRRPVIVFIGGSHHTMEHYQAFIQELEKLEFVVNYVSIPIYDGSVPPTSTFRDSVEHLQAAILSYLDTDEDIVVVMHSFGGALGTRATAGLGLNDTRSLISQPRGRIRSIVYIASFPTPKNLEMEDLRDSYQFEWLTPDIPKGICYADPEGARKELYPDLTPEQQEWALSRVVPFALQPYMNARQGTAPDTPAYVTVPTTYIVTDRDLCIPTEAQVRMIARVKGEFGVDFKQVHLNSGHFPTISMPDKVANIVAASYQRKNGKVWGLLVGFESNLQRTGTECVRNLER